MFGGIRESNIVINWHMSFCVFSRSLRKRIKPRKWKLHHLSSVFRTFLFFFFFLFFSTWSRSYRYPHGEMSTLLTKRKGWLNGGEWFMMLVLYSLSSILFLCGLCCLLLLENFCRLYHIGFFYVYLPQGGRIRSVKLHCKIIWWRDLHWGLEIMISWVFLWRYNGLVIDCAPRSYAICL